MSTESKSRAGTSGADCSASEIAHLTVALEQERVKSQRYRLAAESATNLIYEWDLGSRMEWLGHIDERLGYQPNEIPRTWEGYTNLLHSEDRDGVLAAIQKQLKSEEPYSVECRVQRKDGTYLYWQDQGSVVRDESGKPVKWIGAITDITERKKMEEALRGSEEKYRVLVENAAEAIILVQDGWMKFVNHMASEISGYSNQELSSMPFLDFVHEDDRAMVGERYLRRLKGDVSISKYAFRAIHKDRSFKWVEINAVLVTWEGKPATLNFLADITERKKAEEELNKTTNILDLALDASQIGIWELDLIKDTSVRNLRHDQIFGYTEKMAEWGAKIFFEHIISEDRPSVQAAFDRAMKTDRLHFECRILWPDKSIHWITATGKTVKDNAGKPQKLIGTVTDITERKQAEEMLIHSEKQFQDLANLLPQIVFETDIRGDITFANQFGIRAFGYSSDDVRSGINLSSLVAPENREAIQKRFQESILGSETAVREFRALRKDGTSFPIMLHATGIFKNGVPTGVRGLAIDITERKRTELELLEAKALVETVVEHIPLMIFLKEAADLRFVIFNRAGEELLGYDRKALLGKNNLDLFPPEQAAHFMAKDREALAGRGVVDIPEEFIQTAKKGTRLLHTRKVSIAGEDGTTKFLLGISEDITESKKAEVRLQETLQGLQKALGGIIQVLASVSEIRDPYTAGHQRRVANLAQAIARELGLAPERVEGIRVAGIIHDIGKMSIPAEILSKPGSLSKNEYALIKTHSQVGHDILSNVKFAWPIATMILQHHERMDGSGYPQGLKGDDILLESRILAVADVIEAMSAHRPYRPSLGIDNALREIEKDKGGLYDPAVVSACLTLFREKHYALKE